LKKYIKIDDPLSELSEKIRKGYFESSNPLMKLSVFTFSSSSSGIFFQFRRYILVGLFFLSAIRVFAPDSNTITVIKEPAFQPYSKLLYATAMVETMGNSLAYNEFENAVGIYQIRQVRIDDYNRRTGSNHSLTEMFDPLLSKKIFLYYASRYEPHELEKIAKAWNGSGPMTELYWKRIREYLN
jgi:hypothetical protein